MGSVNDVKDIEWVKHNPVIALRGPEGARENEIVGCTRCGWRSSKDSYDYLGFAAHLENWDAPAYMVNYWRWWAKHVEIPFGQLDRDAVARELADFDRVVENTSKAFDALSGGRFSKPNTDAAYVVQAAEEDAAATYADFLCDHAFTAQQAGNEEVAGLLREIAESWHAGSWQDFEKARLNLR